jgi:ubiquinone/menaquinone biosynthesis C-methylase UbiE
MISSAQRFLSKVLYRFFDLLYHQLAWSYDFVAWVVSAGQWKAWVFSVLPYLEGQDVLEIGHGPGHLLHEMTEKGYHAIGLDASRQMGLKARRKLESAGYVVRLINGYAQFMPFRSMSFNSIVATFPSSYITDPKTLSEAFRILKPGGVMIVLPFATIEGHSLLDHVLTLIFRWTGLTPIWDDRFALPFSHAGFDVTIHHPRLPTSSVVVIHARKP